MIRRISVICTGNVCRSPMGEALLKSTFTKQCLGIVVDSCGTHALAGHSADANAQKIMHAMGINIAQFRARQAVPELILKSDMVLAMEDEHRQWLYRHMPEVRGRVYMFGKWYDEEAIPDPYGRPLQYFQHVGDMLRKNSNKWAEWLIEMGNANN